MCVITYVGILYATVEMMLLNNVFCYGLQYNFNSFDIHKYISCCYCPCSRSDMLVGLQEWNQPYTNTAPRIPEVFLERVIVTNG